MEKISVMKQSSQSKAMGMSGAGMDRAVSRKRSPMRLAGYAVVGIGIVAFVWWFVASLLAGRSLSINSERITVSQVSVGTFEDFIPLRGRLVPRSTVFLDAIEGGRVEEILVEDGELVTAGQAIARLSNTNLQLEVLSREAAVTEQLNNIRTIELQLEQNRLEHKRSLVEIDYQLTRLNRAIARQHDLADRDLVSKSTVDELQDELTYYENRRAITLESQRTDARMQEQQLQQLRDAGEQLQAGLQFARKNLDDLSIRAPLPGKLSGFNIEIGQSIERGGRLGQIDDPSGYKLRVEIDEYYLSRVDLQQRGVAEHGRESIELHVAKIYPQVSGGQFEIDMTLTDAPDGLRRGQTMPVQLTLGDNTDATLIPNGTFYQETAGNWIFVVSPDGEEAVRRNVRLGRRNTEFIEVLDGLQVGEKVITSPYTSYSDMDRLSLDSK